MTHRPDLHSSEPAKKADGPSFVATLSTGLLLCLLLAFSLVGCSSGTDTGGSTGQTSSQPGTETGTAAPTPTAPAMTSIETARPPSGPLRLFCTTRTTLNPLADASASFQAVCRLVYEGLYTVDSTGAVHPVLAESARFLEDGLTLDIDLADDRHFHDGSKVTAFDVAASHDVLKNAGRASAYDGRMPDVVSITAIDESTVRVRLTHADPDYAWQLTFPVVPAASLQASAENPLTVLPGTGRFMIESHEPGKGMVLKAIGSATDRDVEGVTVIHVLELKDRGAAMRAFENDEIDLIDLPPEDYPEYRLRNGLRLERFFSDHYLFISFNTREGSLLANKDRLAVVKALSHDPRMMPDPETAGIQPARVPILPDSFLWENTPTDDPDRRLIYALDRTVPEKVMSAYVTARRKLVILAPQEDPLRAELADRFRELLNEHQIESEVRILANDAYLAERSAGQYDILMAQAVVTDPMDPRWLVGLEADESVAGSEWLSRSGLDGHEEAASEINRCFAAGASTASGWSTLASALREAGETGPFTGIGFRYRALLTGHRVIGQPRPHRQYLLEGIEDIWIWSTFSS